MKDYVQKTHTKFQSNMDIIHLHAQLNDELEKFHKLLNDMKKMPIMEAIHLELERATIMNTIQRLNKRIQSLITTKRQEHLHS